MRNATKSIVVAAGLCAASMGGCAETAGPHGEMETAQGPVRVVPEFRLQGTDRLPERLQLRDLGLAVSEIQLTPIEPDEGVAYTNRKPMDVDFRVGDGETSKKGRELVLPEAGKYDVSLRLEPVRADRPDGGRASDNYSFQLAGFVAGDGIVRVDPRGEGDEQSGDPIPFPASPKREDDAEGQEQPVSDKPALPKQWTPFEYRTDKSVVYTLDEVQFGSGRQLLSFSFDAEQWALELIEPLAEAVRHKTVPEEAAGTRQVVDVTREIDRLGEGPEGLADHMTVRAVRPGSGRGF